MPGHHLRPWAPRIRSTSELLSSRCSLVIPHSPKVASLADIQNMQREGRQASPSHGQACLACGRVIAGGQRMRCVLHGHPCSRAREGRQQS